MATWNAKPEHDWPDGLYIGATCSVCGVRGFNHHKNGPRLCWPHYQDMAQAETERRARELAAMTAEYGPHVPKPSPFSFLSPTPAPKEDHHDR